MVYFKILYWFQKNSICHFANLKILIKLPYLSLCEFVDILAKFQVKTLASFSTIKLSKKLGSGLLMGNAKESVKCLQAFVSMREMNQHSFKAGSANVSFLLQISFICSSC